MFRKRLFILLILSIVLCFTIQAQKADGLNMPEGAPRKIQTYTAVINKFEKAKRTSSGLRYIIEKEGKGESPKMTDKVTIFYKGTFLDGKEFDGNMGKEPVSFGLDQAIKGWVEGIQLMKPGGKAFFYVPFQIAFGEQGRGHIPPKTDLIFEIELVKIN
jgi:peptidyl-prolyl cis-trans isomerase A (cyclophilin A)